MGSIHSWMLFEPEMNLMPQGELLNFVGIEIKTTQHGTIHYHYKASEDL